MTQDEAAEVVAAVAERCRSCRHLSVTSNQHWLECHHHHRFDHEFCDEETQKHFSFGVFLALDWTQANPNDEYRLKFAMAAACRGTRCGRVACPLYEREGGVP